MRSYLIEQSVFVMLLLMSFCWRVGSYYVTSPSFVRAPDYLLLIVF